MIACHRKAVEVKRDGNALIGIFRHATPPVAGRWDLAHLHSFSMAVKKDGDGWALGQNIDGGAFRPVAFFDNEEEAGKAFAGISLALWRQPFNWRLLPSRMLRAMLLLALTLFLVFLAMVGYQLVHVMPSSRGLPGAAYAPPGGASSSASAAGMAAGLLSSGPYAPYAGAILQQMPGFGATDLSGGSVAPAAGMPVPVENGVPLPADQVLKPPGL